METTNANKIALAVLGALLGTMALGVFSNAVFAPNKAAQPGYALAGGETAAAPAAAAAAAPEVPLPALLAKADAAKGQSDVKACQACHSFDKGGPAKVGPPLWGVVGRPVASVAGFAYSDARQGDRRRLDLRQARSLDRQAGGDGGGHQDGFPRRTRGDQARRHSRLPAEAVGQPGSVPAIGGKGAVREASTEGRACPGPFSFPVEDRGARESAPA